MAESNSFFDALNSVMRTKKYWFLDPAQEYKSFFINRGLSQHLDCLLHANLMNMFWRVLTPKMHYDYCYGAIRSIKRPFLKWAKKQEERDIELVMSYYQCNQRRAEEYLQVLNKEHLEIIQEVVVTENENKKIRNNI